MKVSKASFRDAADPCGAFRATKGPHSKRPLGAEVNLLAQMAREPGRFVLRQIGFEKRKATAAVEKVWHGVRLELDCPCLSNPRSRMRQGRAGVPRGASPTRSGTSGAGYRSGLRPSRSPSATLLPANAPPFAIRAHLAVWFRRFSAGNARPISTQTSGELRRNWFPL